MFIVIALGGNALLKRGEPLEAELQLENVKNASKKIAALAREHQVVICHGNGPQVGLLALQSESYKKIKSYPLDVLDAESQGMIGYLIQQQVGNELQSQSVVTLLTQVLVDKNDPAFSDPSKPIGPVYSKEEAEQLSISRGWKIAQDGDYYRRVVPSPKPKDIIEFSAIQSLLEKQYTVICGGGGGIPVVRDDFGSLSGIEAVIDKDNTASLIAEKLNAKDLIILTDVSCVCENFGTPQEKKIKSISVEDCHKMGFAKGSMGPKIEAASRFVNNTGNFAAIGNLIEIEDIIACRSGTLITKNRVIEYY